jgi:hypothetical protein
LPSLATTASKWILIVSTFRWILAANASTGHLGQSSSTPPPTFRPGILAAATLGTSSYKASPDVGNASVDDTDVVMTFFTTDDKSFVSILSIVPFVI